MIDRLVTAAPALIFAAYQQAIQSEIEADRIRRIEDYANQTWKEDTP